MTSLRSFFSFVLTCFFLVTAETSLAKEYIWWEGENPLKSNFPENTWFSQGLKEKADLLSGGKWLTNIGKREGDEAFATYSIEVPESGKYTFWSRKFWSHGPFRWRFDSGEWQICGKDIALADNVGLITHICVNWVNLGEVKLDKGNHIFELRLLAEEGEEQSACFDCFLLTQDTFEPNGKLKPGEKTGQADAGFFAWEPSADTFADNALLDLRFLNEKTAGQSGHVSRRGNDFILGDGKPVRFWGVNLSAGNAAQDRNSIDYLARKLAKLGVNMIRFHSAMFAESGDPARVDPGKLDNLHYLISAMKREGIYTKISFYFPLWFDIKNNYGIEGYTDFKNKTPFCLLYFDKRMQQIYKSWARSILTTKNPYTGAAIANDPEAAIIEIINEDSYFFWTFGKGNIPPAHWKHLETLYNAWLDKRYPTQAPHRRELYEAWHMTGDGIRKAHAADKQPIMDQVRFLTEQQKNFYSKITEYFKGELGFKGLVSASNWHTADDSILGGLERYTYSAADVIDRHGYFGGDHKGDGASWSVRTGHTYSDKSGLLDPSQLPVQVMQVEGYPHIISELGWPNPNRYKAESTVMGSTYASLQGIDGLFWFAVGNNSLSDKSMRKFAVGTPSVAAMFPAMALQYRKGYIKESKPVVFNHYKLEDLYSLKGSAAAAQALDELRKVDQPGTKDKRGPQGIDPLLFYTGGVYQQFSGAKSGRELNAGTCTVRKSGTVQSVTDEIELDCNRGILSINTPKSRGVTGFCSRTGEMKLGNVSIKCKNNYASITLISLDDKALEESRKILIQSMTYDQPFGFKVNGNRIENLGSAPFEVEKIQAAVRIQFTSVAKTKVTALDENGYATDKPVSCTPDRDGIVISLRDDAVYHVIEQQK